MSNDKTTTIHDLRDPRLKPRDVRVAVHSEETQRGYEVTVTLTHRPTGKSAVGRASSYDAAKAIAETDLEMAVEGHPNPTPGFIH